MFGLIVSNTVGVPAIFRAGVDTYEFWLKIGIVLLAVDNTAEAASGGALYSDAAARRFTF